MPRISSRSTRYAIDKLRERTPEFTAQDIDDVLPMIETGVPARDPAPLLASAPKQEAEQVQPRMDPKAATAHRHIDAGKPLGSPHGEDRHVDGHKIQQRLVDDAFRAAGHDVDREGYYSQYADLDW